MRASLVMWLIIMATPVAANMVPRLEKSDPRIALARYSGDGPIRIDLSTGARALVLMPPGQNLTNVTIGNSGCCDVLWESGAESFTVRANGSGGAISLIAMTATRTWNFVLAPSPGGSSPQVIRIIDKPSRSSSRARPTVRWVLSGRRELLPSSIYDDGAKTYIEWPPERPMPAVFVVDRLGREEMVNGYMRGSAFTIDRVYDHLLFRIEKASADARRKVKAAS